MFLVYCYIKPFYSTESKSKDNFFKKLADLLEQQQSGRLRHLTIFTIDQTESMVQSFSMIFSFVAMKEFRNTRPDVLEKALLHM